MGVTWRRLNEKVLQSPIGFKSFSSSNFQATSNGRNEAMFQEATRFAKSIGTLHKDLKTVMKHVEAHFANLRAILLSPIPRVFEEGAYGPVPVENDGLLLGQGMDAEAIPRAAADARHRITVEVVDPLMEWMDAYKVLTERMKSLEALRLELDSRRRTVSSLQNKHNRMRGNLTTSHKHIAELQELEDTLAHKEDKMGRCMSQFQELERTVYNSLYTLVKDTSVLRDYTHSALCIVQSCFEQASAAYSVPSNDQALVPYVQPSQENRQQAVGARAAPAKPAYKAALAGMFGKLMGKRDTDKHSQHDQQYQQAPAAVQARDQPDAMSRMDQVQYGMPLAPPPASPLQPNQWQPAGAGYGEYLPQGAAPAMDFTPGKHVAQGMMRPSNGSDGSEVHACPAGAAAPTPTKHIATPLAGHAAAGGSFSSSNSKQHVAQQLPAAGGDHLDAPAYGAWQQPAGAPATAYAPPSAPAAYAPVSAWGAQPTLDLHQDAQDEDGLPPMGGFDAHSPASKYPNTAWAE